jgi:hypothetical protein
MSCTLTDYSPHLLIIYLININTRIINKLCIGDRGPIFYMVHLGMPLTKPKLYNSKFVTRPNITLLLF